MRVIVCYCACVISRHPFLSPFLSFPARSSLQQTASPAGSVASESGLDRDSLQVLQGNLESALANATEADDDGEGDGGTGIGESPEDEAASSSWFAGMLG